MFLLTSLGSPEHTSLSSILYRGEVSDGDITYHFDSYYVDGYNPYWKTRLCQRFKRLPFPFWI